MESKSGFPSSNDDDILPPPSYNESLVSNPSKIDSSNSCTSQYYSQQIQSQLSNLSTQINSLKTHKSLLDHAQYEKILSLLTPHIQIYLSSFANAGLARGTLILIPARGLEDENNPQVAEFEDKAREGIVEFDQLVKIRGKEGEGEESWFWKDEDMAIRLAGYLRPVRDLKNQMLPLRKEELKAVAEQSTGRGFWGRKKSSVKSVERPPLVEDGKVEPPPAETGREKVVMDVRAEEVVFRMENEFGVYETRRGWGIVLKLKVLQAR